MSKLIHVFGVPHDPVGVAVGQYRQSVTASEHQSQQKQASVTGPCRLARKAVDASMGVAGRSLEH
jgi:hypothetical protein